MAKTIRQPLSTRVLRGLLVALVLVAVAWTALWFGVAIYAENEFEERTAALAREGRADIACGSHGVHGYPFAFRFACDEDVMVETERADIALVGVEAGTSVFTPSTVTAELDGPANVALAPGRTLRADWARANVVASDLFGRRSFALDLDVLDLDLAGTGLKAAGTDIALTPEVADLRIAGSATDIALTLPGRAPTLVPALHVDMQLEGLHRRLIQEGRSFDPRNGLRGTIERLRLDAEGEGRVFVSGPFEISPEGRLSGRFTIAVRDPDALARLVAPFEPEVGGFPGALASPSGALTALGTLGEPRTIDGVEMRALDLEAVDGRLPFGLFNLNLPQLWQRPPDG